MLERINISIFKRIVYYLLWTCLSTAFILPTSILHAQDEDVEEYWGDDEEYDDYEDED